MTNSEIIKEAIALIGKYRLNIINANIDVVQQFREDFVEYKRLVSDILVTYEDKVNKIDLERKLKTAELFFKYKNDTEKKYSEESIRQQLVLDTEGLRKQELDVTLQYRKLKELYLSLADYANASASRIKSEKL